MGKRIHCIASIALLTLAGSSAWAAVPKKRNDLPDWVAKIRSDHPRLFFNAETWPAVRARALDREKAWYDRVKRQVDGARARPARDEPADRGEDAAKAAFVYRMTRERKYLDHARRCLDEALDFYEFRYEQRRSVNWYSTSRVHAVMAWDWLFKDVPAEYRVQSLSRLVNVLDLVLTAKPRIHRENYSGYTTGFYGVRNALWFLGCTAYGTGIEPQRVNRWLIYGHDENLKLLEHRRKACGDDGGGASPTLGYIFGAYPWSEQNFFYTWLSSTGENIAPAWPHSGLLANYVLWNWISSAGDPRAFGYGDTPHTGNKLPISHMYTHMANIRHLYGKQLPQAASLANFIQESLPAKRRAYTGTWFIYPFLLTDQDATTLDLSELRLPHARHFDNMGQVFMRSGTGVNDTYCLFTCGGILRQHRHYDALNFVIHHRGFLALDSGTRYRETENGQHLANYFAQTVAHNCMLIHQPREPIARYWGGKVEGCHGGQHSQLGSVLRAFESNDSYVYVAGDATECYQHSGRTADGKEDLPQKVRHVSRQMVFLMPDHFVIFDRVSTALPGLRKEWLLHTAHEPRIEGQTFRADHGEGRMFCRTVLPKDAVLTAVGGPEKKFWSAGKNWELVETGLSPEQLATIGQWRVEISPPQARTEDLFLHVIQVGDSTMEQMGEVGTVSTEVGQGVRVATKRGTWEVLFAASGELGGHIRCLTGGPDTDTDLTRSVTPQVGITTVQPPEKGVLMHLPSASQAAEKQVERMSRMTLKEARLRIPRRTLPNFWVGDSSKLASVLKSVARGKITELGRTPGGRPLTVVIYGGAESARSAANFNSAVGARKPEAYADKSSRKYPVVALIGPVHGHGAEAVTGLCNLIQVLETGKDMRGQPQAQLRSLADKCRLLIIPFGNPDGTARFMPGTLNGMETVDVQFWGQGTKADTTLWGWPGCKERHPMSVQPGGFLGCYFNDAGVNPMHDEFFAPMGPESKAILELMRREAPDGAVFFFGGTGVPSLMRPAYVPALIQRGVADLAESVGRHLEQRDLPYGRPPPVLAEDRIPPAPFNLISAAYHVSGATAFGFTCPHGLRKSGVGNPCQVTLEEILEIQLTFCEALLAEIVGQQAK